MSWYETLIEKAQELERIADWASAVNCGTVRDYCRKAAHEIRELASNVMLPPDMLPDNPLASQLP